MLQFLFQISFLVSIFLLLSSIDLILIIVIAAVIIKYFLHLLYEKKILISQVLRFQSSNPMKHLRDYNLILVYIIYLHFVVNTLQ